MLWRLQWHAGRGSRPTPRTLLHVLGCIHSEISKCIQQCIHTTAAYVLSGDSIYDATKEYKNIRLEKDVYYALVELQANQDKGRYWGHTSFSGVVKLLIDEHHSAKEKEIVGFSIRCDNTGKDKRFNGRDCKECKGTKRNRCWRHEV